MKRISIDAQDEQTREFLQSLAVDPEGSILELHGQPLLRVLPAESLTDAEKDALLARGRELVRKARERNRGTPAKVIEREVREAVDEVRRRKQQ